MKPRIFSGEDSTELWDLINSITDKKNRKSRKKLASKLWEVIYTMSCKCQELEDEVRKLKR